MSRLQSLSSSICRFLVAALVIASLCAAPTPVEAGVTRGETTQAVDRALKLEQGGELVPALAAVRGVPLSRAQAQSLRLAQLRDAVDSLNAARIYEARHEWALAGSVLSAVAAQLDPVRDVYVRAVIQDEAAKVKAKLAPRPKVKAGFFASLWSDVKSTARTVLKWVVVIAAALLLAALIQGIGAFVRRRRSARTGIGVALQDLSAESAKRATGNRALGQELSVAIAAASQSSSDGPQAEVDVARDMDGGVTLNVRVAGDELAALDPYLEDGSPVKVGPLSVSPRQVVAFLGGAFRRRYEYELHGSFAASGTTSRLSVELRPDGKAPVRWTSSADGEASRAAVLLDVARRILFEAAKDPISASWPSVSAYQSARAQLATTTGLGQREATLREAQRLLELSLNRDPSNALARFELGGVLRKLGQNAEAVSQYEFLRSNPGAGNWQDDPRVRRGIEYSSAVALSKIDRWEEHNRALGLLDGLRTEVEQEPDSDEREALLLQIRSAWSATKVFEAERFRHDDAARDRLLQVLLDVGGEREWIAASPTRHPTGEFTSYVQARAVAENALGRVRYLAGDPRHTAIPAFESALSLVPEFEDAHANLASALLRASGRYPNWFTRADAELGRALEISPRDAKAMFLRAELYLKAGRGEEARTWLGTAETLGDDWATMRIAELDWEAGKRPEAVVRALRAVTAGPEYDYRMKLLVIWVGELARVDGVADKSTLQAARGVGRTLVRKAEKGKKTVPARVNDALRRIDARLQLTPDA